MNKQFATGFSKTKGLPVPHEEVDRQLEFMKWGKNNDYPFFLIDMFNGSAWHQGIVRQKTHYISGGGLSVVQGELSKFLENEFSDFDIQEIISRATLDFEIFDAFAIMGTWNNEGTRVSRWEHIDVDKVRKTEDGTMFFLSDDWSKKRQTAEETGLRQIPALNTNARTGRFIIYYQTPVKSAKGEKGVYPKPNYIGGLTAINTDVLISKYHLHEIQNGFKGGTLINLANGQPETREEAEAIKDEIKGRTTSVEDANEVIITFSDGTDRQPSVLSLNGNDLADRYNLTEKSVQQNIMVAHSATNPLLFGIKTEGQLGGATELMESYEIFKNIYVNSRQKCIEWVLNYMVELSGFVGKLKLNDAKPLGSESTEQPEQVQQSKFSMDDDLKIFAEYGKKKESFKIVKSFSVSNEFGKDEVAKMEETNFKTFFDKIGDILLTLTDLDKNVLELLKQGQDGNDIAKALDAPLVDVAKSVQKLTEINLLVDGQTSSLGERLLERTETDIDQFEIRYSYEVKPGLGAEIIPGSRDFCRELIRQDRMYLRSEIDTIGTRVNRDVWRYRGGFYHNPDTDRTTPWCRHEWVQHLVIKS